MNNKNRETLELKLLNSFISKYFSQTYKKDKINGIISSNNGFLELLDIARNNVDIMLSPKKEQDRRNAYGKFLSDIQLILEYNDKKEDIENLDKTFANFTSNCFSR